MRISSLLSGQIVDLVGFGFGFGFGFVRKEDKGKVNVVAPKKCFYFCLPKLSYPTLVLSNILPIAFSRH